MPFFPFKYAKELVSMGNAEKTGTGRCKMLPNTTRPFRGRSSFVPYLFTLCPHTTILLNRKTMTRNPGHREGRVQERTGTGNNQFSEKHRCVDQFHRHSHFKSKTRALSNI